MSAGPAQAKPRGRPPGVRRVAPSDATKPRSMRLNDSRWEKLQRLGRVWLENVIDMAGDPGEPPR